MPSSTLRRAAFGVHRLVGGRCRPAGLVVGLALLLLAACGKAPDLVVYVSADEQVARPVIDAFERESGLKVAARFDTEATKTTALASALRAERDRPRADVFWSSECFAMAQLAKEGILEPVTTGIFAEWPAAYRDAEQRWFGFSARARVLVYAPDRVAPEEVPDTWMDLTRPWWKGRIAMADPRFGTTRGHFGAMQSFFERSLRIPGYWDAFIEGFAENQPQLLTGGNAAVVDAVARGEADIGLTDTDDVLAAQARGAKVQWIMARHDPAADRGGGTLLIPNTVGLVAGAPHRSNAVWFMAYLVSAGVQERLAASESRNWPLGVDAPAGLDPLPDDPMRVDVQDAADRMDAAVADLLKALGR
jgi:iron(III) transport system substrate-binding protein